MPGLDGRGALAAPRSMTWRIGVQPASFVGIVAKNLLPALAGETMHTVTQLGTIGFAFALRFWLVRRYAPSRAPMTSPSARVDAT